MSFNVKTLQSITSLAKQRPFVEVMIHLVIHFLCAAVCCQSHVPLIGSHSIRPVNLQILIATLAKLGIADSVLSWFTSYLTNRTYQVTWNGSLSKPCTLDTGVLQGSVLGTLLFSLYTRSLGSVIASQVLFSYSLSFPSSDSTLITTRISECLASVLR